ncbi:hypothetical protein D0Z07_4393 [Hyphodiscus hymeniophilus]|uniref:Uncharacterized protein n=1 Tax=Hyphodiscus hymeniophilus TaxID=353542 RepID=A0A9P6VK33_9HELO|nr:hypothetical protein D0Z07_4393 [Hyphodiscus hymeniophilus]
MPIFAIPIVNTSSAPRSRAHFSSIPVRNKRKRKTSPTPSLSDDDDDARSQYNKSEAAASTNPLSLTPAEVVQYRLAGLNLDEQIPKIKEWPHRGLAPERSGAGVRNASVDTKGKAKLATETHDTDEDGIEIKEDGDEIEVETETMDERMRDQRPPKLRSQHLAVLTAILQRCLLEGDIPRASRAWAMLVRVQVGGHAMDLRASGYWAIGAELLIRSGERPPARKQRRNADAESDDGMEDDQELEQESSQNIARNYGSLAGLENAKDYYEKLILQHPYNRQWKENVSALDFWPAMVGCEVYGIQQQQKDSLRKVVAKEDEDNEHALSSPSDSEPEMDKVQYRDNVRAVEERRETRRYQRRSEKRWQERDDIRMTALTAYEKLAARLDELLTTLPYSDSPTMLRLRGMLALCVGDLTVPTQPHDDGEEIEDEERLDRDGRLAIRGEDTEHRLLLRQRIAEHKRAQRKQREEYIRARQLFERIERTGGRKEAITSSLPQEEDETYES